MSSFVAYYRVSTDRQGKSGLGLDAQREAVQRFVGPQDLAGEFTEVESGKTHHNRPQLAAALARCRVGRHTLVIAKLDRLARNVHFISGLMESKVEFVAVDMPQANPLTIHILAAVAEHERKMISQRVRDALQQAKKRGKVLGNPRLGKAREHAALVNRTNTLPGPVRGLITAWREKGKTWRAVAAGLNELNIRTGRGKVWHASTARLAFQAKGVEACLKED